MDQSGSSKNDLKFRIRNFEAESPTFIELNTFIQKCRSSSQKDKTNITNINFGVGANIPAHLIPKFFKLYKDCYDYPKSKVARKSDPNFQVQEKQLSNSCLMVDLDIYQKTSERLLNSTILQNISEEIIKNCIQGLLNFQDDVNIFVAVTGKPNPVEVYMENSTDNMYREGFHIIIYLRMPTVVKREILTRFSEIFEDLINEHIDPKLLGDNISNWIDMGSSKVPIFLLGSASKPDKVPYKLLHLFEFKVRLKSRFGILKLVKSHDINEELDKRYNLPYELSVNWEVRNVKDKLITKHRFTLHADFKSKFENKQSPKDIEQSDQDTRVKNLLDCLAPKRYTDYVSWHKVLMLLAGLGSNYEDLARYFSKKCESKFDELGFSREWNICVDENKKLKSSKKLGLGSLHFWAKQDDPENYRTITQNTLSNIVSNYIYSAATKGLIQPAMMARLIKEIYPDKYVTTSPNGKDYQWYEFISDNDAHEEGEIYKWRCLQGPPISLSLLMTDVLSKEFNNYKNSLNTKTILLSKKDEEDNKKRKSPALKALQKIVTNIIKTINNLQSPNYKKSVIQECRDIFNQYGFIKKLNTDPYALGVGNGVLYLKDKIYPRLHTGYNTFNICEHTEVNYNQFDPRDPQTKRLLFALRSIFPDDEPDTFEYVISHAASCLDAKSKTSMVMMLIGGGSNGKSVWMELLKNVLGEYGVKLKLGLLVDSKRSSEGATPGLMALKNARFAYFSESNNHEELNCAKIKELTGGETLAARGLFKGIENFRPKCHFLIGSNYPFIIHGNDDGIWRRMVKVDMKIKFCDGVNTIKDPNNPNHRDADTDIQDTFITDPEVLSKYLSILVFYYHKLHTKYGGKLNNVPHPHIKRSSEQYRSEQDMIYQFIRQHVCTKIDPKKEQEYATIDLQTYINAYQSWYEKISKSKKPTNIEVRQAFTSSIIKGKLRNKNERYYVEGLRLIDPNDQDDIKLRPDERMLCDSKRNTKIDVGIESPQDYYDRIVYEWDVLKTQIDKETHEIDYDVKENNILDDKPSLDILTKKMSLHSFSAVQDMDPTEDSNKLTFQNVKKTIKVPNIDDIIYDEEECEYLSSASESED